EPQFGANDNLPEICT
ncbi:unnamed protein product, partial [Rotaria sp. Silwood2]